MATPPYDNEAQDALMTGQALTGQHRLAQFEPEALVLGLLEASDGEVARVLRALAIDPSAVRLDAERALDQLPSLQHGTEVSIASNRLRNALSRAESEAITSGDGTVGARHLLFGVLAAADSTIARDLARRGASSDAVRRLLASKGRRAGVVDPPAPEPTTGEDSPASGSSRGDVPTDMAFGASDPNPSTVAEASALLGDLIRATRAAVAIVESDLEAGSPVEQRMQAANAWLDRAPALLDAVSRLCATPNRTR